MARCGDFVLVERAKTTGAPDNPPMWVNLGMVSRIFEGGPITPSGKIVKIELIEAGVVQTISTVASPEEILGVAS